MTHVGLIHFRLKNMRIFFFFLLEILMIIMCCLTNALTKVLILEDWTLVPRLPVYWPPTVIGLCGTADKQKHCKPQNITNNTEIKSKFKKKIKNIHATEVGAGKFLYHENYTWGDKAMSKQPSGGEKKKKKSVKTSFQCTNWQKTVFGIIQCDLWYKMFL